MTKETSIKLFESKKIRVSWNNEEEKWYFSIIDIIETLTGSMNPRRYWSDLKRKLTKEGFSQLYEIIVQLKLESSDGKKYSTDCADTEWLQYDLFSSHLSCTWVRKYNLYLTNNEAFYLFVLNKNLRYDFL